ncbi:MAG: amino acid ABC transporter permease [Clostridia bacterium]|nr:amino acid ABC transporter permease [Clostridia bacterium]
MELFFEHFITKGGYKVALEGLLATAEIAVFGLIIGILLGTVIAIVRVMPKYKVLPRVLDVICNIYVALFRGTPMVVQLLVGYYVLLPAIGLRLDGVVVAVIIFGLNSAAYVSEMMRSGIQSVDIGQLEAARALGMPYAMAMMKIVIPQSIKNILPTLGNEFIVLVKDTSIVSFIAVVDITKAFRQIGDATYEYVIPYLFLALVYLVLVAGIAALVKLMERRLKKSERQ